MYFWDLLCYCYSMDTLLSILVRQSTIDRKSILCWLSKSYTVTMARLFTHDWRLLLRPFKLITITATKLWNRPPTRIHCNYIRPQWLKKFFTKKLAICLLSNILFQKSNSPFHLCTKPFSAIFVLPWPQKPLHQQRTWDSKHFDAPHVWLHHWGSQCEALEVKSLIWYMDPKASYRKMPEPY